MFPTFLDIILYVPLLNIWLCAHLSFFFFFFPTIQISAEYWWNKVITAILKNVYGIVFYTTVPYIQITFLHQ